MSVFAYASGSLDQIGGNITIPPSVTHLPRFQGSSFTLPEGLAITGNRAFIWELAKPYNGVLGITGQFSQTPTINFDPEVFSEPFIEIRCRVRGQALNFIRYFLFTALSTTYTAGATTYATLEFTDYKIKDPSFTIDNSIRIEADFGNQIISNLILFWKPPNFKNVKHYIIEKWGTGWEPVGITSVPSYIIPKEEITYKITTIFSLERPGINQVDYIEIKPEGILAKDILALYQNTFTYLNFSQPQTSNVFYTSFENFDIEDSLIYYQETFNTSLSQNTDSYIDTFWIQVQEDFYEDSTSVRIETFTNNNLNQNTNTYSEIFWSQGIGI